METYINKRIYPGIPNITIDDIYPCRVEVMTFSEKEVTNSWLRKVWGFLQIYLGSGSGVITGLIGSAISVMDAKKLLDDYQRNKWSNEKFIEEVKKAAHDSKRTAQTLWGIEGIATLLGSSALAPMVGIGVIPFIFLTIVITGLGLTIGGFLSKRGFVRLVEGFSEKEIMSKLNK